MKQKMIIAGILSMALVLTGCGQAADTSSTEETTAPTTAATEAETEETTEATTEAETEATTEATTEAATEAETEAETEEENGEEDASEAPASEEELAAVQAAIDGYLKAAEEADYANLVKYYDIELVNYMTTGKMATEEELIAELQRQVDEGEMAVGTPTAGLTIGEPVCYNSQAQTYNDFLASDMLSETTNENGETVALNMAENFTIDGVYMFEYGAAGDEEGVEFDISMDMAVLRINGEWKVDTGLTMMMAFATMFENME